MWKKTKKVIQNFPFVVSERETKCGKKWSKMIQMIHGSDLIQIFMDQIGSGSSQILFFLDQIRSGSSNFFSWIRSDQIIGSFLDQMIQRWSWSDQLWITKIRIIRTLDWSKTPPKNRMGLRVIPLVRSIFLYLG